MEEGTNSNFHAKETLRLEAFSDGVFAIAITLLILEIHVPVAEKNETLLKSLSHEWPSFLALLIGFFTLLVCWINHQYMFSLIHKSNSRLSLINGFKLLVVTITPFATALLSKNILGDMINSAVSIYAFNFTLMGFAMTGIWVYSKRKGFIQAQSPLHLLVTTRYYILASIISSAIWLVSYINIACSLTLFVVMFVIYVFPEKIISWQMARIKKKSVEFEGNMTATNLD